MDSQLTGDDIDVILESLKYSKRAIEDYPNHPSPEFKQNKLKRLDTVMAKVRSLRDEIRKE
jgi:hypothetical protein